jgi:hypothetical protein
MESALYVKKKWGTIYGTLGMGYGKKGYEWLQKEGSRCDYQIDGNYNIFGQFWTDSSLESPGCFLIMRHTFLWDNQDRSRDHPHRMGSGNLCNLCGCLRVIKWTPDGSCCEVIPAFLRKFESFVGENVTLCD